MCELCITGARTICEPIKGWRLIVAREDGLLTQARAGDFGLVSPSDQDIDIVIPKEVMPREPHKTWAEISERDFEKMTDIERAQENELMERVAHFAREVHMKAGTLSAIAELALACRDDGWDPEVEYLEYWLSAKLGKAMQENM